MPHTDTPQPDIIPARHSKRAGAAPYLLILLVVVALALVWRYGMQGGGPDLVNWTDDHDAGLAAARAADKPALLVFTATWCGPCQQMKRTVYSRQEVADALHERTVPILIDVSSRPAPPNIADLAARYGVRVIPALVITDGDGNEIAQHSGPMSSKQLLAWLDAAAPAPPPQP